MDGTLNARTINVAPPYSTCFGEASPAPALPIQLPAGQQKRRVSAVIEIAISPTAYEAIKSTLQPGTTVVPEKRNSNDG